MDREAQALGKALWTDADFELMGWHDATIHAWSQPARPGKSRRLSVDSGGHRST